MFPTLKDAKQEAIALGWKEDKVQIRRNLINRKVYYTVEPYHNCNCQGVIRYRPSEEENGD